MSEAEKSKLEAEQARWSRLRNQRKMVFKELWLQFVDIKMNNSEEKISKSDLWEELGCDGNMP